MTWPTIQQPATIDGYYYKKQHKSTFETGKIISRAAHDDTRLKFVLKWPAMEQSDLSLLLAAFSTDLGSTFLWTYPFTDSLGAEITYTVGYASDQIKFTTIDQEYELYQVEVELEQR